ncbi:MAG: DNA cytosine methyltransferase [Bryobacteraceae bacterium]|nr:DNA cytosine methyltransferase [Bryobacteraceae bacterium]
MPDVKPRLLDLFCGAGGAAHGYVLAGFEVVGVDIKPQPRYLLSGASEFYQADALEFCAECGQEFDAIHASPPCQRYTALAKMWNVREYPDLVAPTRDALIATGVAWVIENVPGAPLRDPFMLCGSMFRLGCKDAELRRHRYFEAPCLTVMAPPCDHGWKARTCAVYGHAGGKSHRQRRTIGDYGGHGRDRRRQFNCQGFSTAARSEAMGIGWMTGAELSQAIPPAYTQFIGERLMAHLKEQDLA